MDKEIQVALPIKLNVTSKAITIKNFLFIIINKTCTAILPFLIMTSSTLK